MPTTTPTPGPAEVYAALWLGAILRATGAPIDPIPPALADLARRYFEWFPPEAKAWPTAAAVDRCYASPYEETHPPHQADAESREHQGPKER